MTFRIALIHATPVAIEPIHKAFAEDWPEAELVNLLDDSLSTDLNAAGYQTPAIKSRMVALAEYARDIGSDALLFSCSAFGEAIDIARQVLTIPVLKPNQAMFEEALEAGATVGLLATFGPSVASMENEFIAMAAEKGKQIKLETLLVEDAMAALKAGDAATHNRLAAEASVRLSHCDAVMLAHFSTSRALSMVSDTITSKVLTSPHSAVAKIRVALGA